MRVCPCVWWRWLAIRNFHNTFYSSIDLIMSSQVDMSKHTDAKGIVHTVHPDFLEGDIVLLSADKYAFRFSRSRLADVR